MSNRLKTALGIIQALVGIGAAPAGLLMIIDPSGKTIGIPIELLSNSPFKSFLIPGIFLFFFNGALNLIGSVFSLRKSVYTGKIGLFLGVFLVLWIMVQVYFIRPIHFLQALYFGIGLVEIVLSLIIISKSPDLKT